MRTTLKVARDGRSIGLGMKLGYSKANPHFLKVEAGGTSYVVVVASHENVWPQHQTETTRPAYEALNAVLSVSSQLAANLVPLGPAQLGASTRRAQPANTNANEGASSSAPAPSSHGKRRAKASVAMKPRLCPWAGLESRPTIVHADWSGSNAEKRWCATAQWSDDHYFVRAPEKIGEDVGAWLETQVGRRNVILGIDFAIGMPRRFRPDDPMFLDLLKTADATFFTKTNDITQVSEDRPFFHGKGIGIQQTWAAALKQSGAQDLLRVCEVGRPQYGRAPGKISLWCVGAGHVGTATAHGWSTVLRACLELGVDIWPFQRTDLGAAFARSAQELPRVLVETYPADAYSVLGVRGSAKTEQSFRTEAGTRILEVLASYSRIELEPSLERELRDGFGHDETGEDRFDAVVGALLMVLVALGERSAGLPSSDPFVSTKEGWILGCD